jgi:hypothetical protein
MLRFVAAGLVVAIAGCSAVSYSQGAPQRPDDQIARALIRMTPSDRLRALRPRDLKPGTRIYRPVVIEIETPGNSYVVSRSSVVASTPTELSVRMAGTIVHFARSASTITVRAGAQEDILPPGVAADPSLGEPIETIR